MRYDQIALAMPIFRSLTETGAIGDWPEATTARALALGILCDRLEQGIENQPSLDEAIAELRTTSSGGDHYKRQQLDWIIYKTAIRLTRKLVQEVSLRTQAFRSLPQNLPGWEQDPWKQWLQHLAMETKGSIWATFHNVSREDGVPEFGVASDSYTHWFEYGTVWEDERFEPNEILPWTISSIRAYLLHISKTVALHSKLNMNWPYLLGIPNFEISSAPAQSEFDYLENTAWLAESADDSSTIQRLTPAEGIELLLDDFEQDVELLSAVFGIDEPV